MTANEIKFIKKLHQKKYRYETQHYFVEGLKLMHEAIDNVRNDIEKVFLSNPDVNISENIPVTYISTNEMSRISALKTPSEAFVLLKMPQQKKSIEGNCVYLEDIKDPGNMGTIIRTADWFGLQTIYYSQNCVDVFNPKMIQSTMGSFFRINLIESSLEILSKQKTIIGATLDGELLGQFNVPENFCLVIGNESKGIGSDSLELLHKTVKIPGYGQAESLNASIAAGILMHEFTRSKN